VPGHSKNSRLIWNNLFQKLRRRSFRNACVVVVLAVSIRMLIKGRGDINVTKMTPRRDPLFNPISLFSFVSNYKWVTIFILIAHPLGALFADLIQGFAHSYFVKMRPGMYILATGFACLTPIAFASFDKMSHGLHERNGQKSFFLLTAIPMVALTLFVQTVCYLELHTDAQAAIAFFIVPICAVVVFSLYAGILFFFFRKK
jgi:hypothetical protein